MVAVIAAVTSAATTGVIEVVLFYARPRLQRRQWVKDHVLGPMYNFLNTFLHRPWEYTPDPWPQFGEYDRLRVPERTRRLIQNFSDAYSQWQGSKVAFSNFTWSGERPDLVQGLMSILQGLLNDRRIVLERFGMPKGYVVDVDSLYNTLYPFVIRNMADPERAWENAKKSGEVKAKYIDVVIKGLQTESPKLLEEVHRLFSFHPSTPRAQELLRTIDDNIAVVLPRGEALRRLLERKLS